MASTASRGASIASPRCRSSGHRGCTSYRLCDAERLHVYVRARLGRQRDTSNEDIGESSDRLWILSIARSAARLGERCTKRPACAPRHRGSPLLFALTLGITSAVGPPVFGSSGVSGFLGRPIHSLTSSIFPLVISCRASPWLLESRFNMTERRSRIALPKWPRKENRDDEAWPHPSSPVDWLR
jgi:hypothetical protein